MNVFKPIFHLKKAFKRSSWRSCQIIGFCFLVLQFNSIGNAQTPSILTPYAWGEVTSGTLEGAVRMFDRQPSWNGIMPSAPSVTNDDYINGFWNAGGTAYVDFGPDWQNLRITECWTQYIVWRSGSGVNYASVWWDNSINTSPGSGSILETNIQFASQPHDSSGAWVRDRSFGTAVTPKARYLMLKNGSSPSSDACEYAFIGYNASPSIVLIPAGWGEVTPNSLDGATRMFDHQPTWNGTIPSAAASTSGSDYINAPWNGGYTACIDFGANWRNVRIRQCWTQYTVWRSGPGVNYASVWWDNLITATPGPGSVMEPNIQFASQPHDSSGPWVRDGNFNIPVTPKGRYLMLKNGPSPANEACEYTFIGYLDFSTPNSAPMVQAGSALSVQWNAHLQGTVSDDGRPNPPGALTLTWSKVSGPGTVSFTNPSSATTDTSFSAAGNYVLRLTANDNGTAGLSGSADVNVAVANATVSQTMPEVKAFNYSQLTLVDEINCGNPNDPHAVIESTAGNTQIQSILGRSCRVLTNPVGAPARYFAYRIGAGKNLQAGKAYVLVMEYPEDQSRQVIAINRGCETTRTFHTGITVGDAINGPYTPSNPNSMHMGLSQQYRTMEMLFHLHNNYPGLIQPRESEAPRDNTPANGFLVMVAHYARSNEPLSAGAAIARIALYEAPSLASYTQQVTFPPNNLPRRHLFWREEMADGATTGVANPIDWFEWKAQTAKFLGMNTYSLDMLEFGYNQGWSSAKYYPFYNVPVYSNRWENILYRFAQGGYNLDILPYYEYAGSNGGDGSNTLGLQKRAKPLIGINNGNDYTGIWWSEAADVDCTDPDTYVDARKLLECTISDLSGQSGGRPLPLDTNWVKLAVAGVGKWGYIDLGPNFANLRISQTWTRSLQYAGGSATPYAKIYWSDVKTGFSGSTVPSGAVQETRINFMTQPQAWSESYWTRDMNLTQANAITPPKRYLALQCPASVAVVNQFLLVGWDATVSPVTIKTLPVAGSGYIDGSGVNIHDLSLMFSQQPSFNTSQTQFVGAWFRTRQSEIPIGFADSTRARFAVEANGGVAVTKDQLNTNTNLMNSYTTWWMGKRKQFLNNLRDYLQQNVNPSSVVLFTWDPTEEGAPAIATGQVIADDPDKWVGITSTMDYQAAVNTSVHLNSMLAPEGIFPSGTGQEEWRYSVPWPDPANYQNNAGVMLTHTFSKPYTVSDPASWNAFRTQSGVAAIHHYCLNEDCMGVNGDIRVLLGYFVTDADPAGPYVTLSEARAVAYGDPYYIGYLSSNSFNRCSPGYVRDFNANYLALPALSSVTVANAASVNGVTDNQVVVRKIVTPSNGTWLAVVNTALTEKIGAQITPGVSGTVTDAVTGGAVSLTNGKIVLDMWPGRLKCYRIQ